MDRRITRIFVLGFSCLWFGMLVPIHQRGQIRLPGPALSDGAVRPVQHCDRRDAGAACSRNSPQPGTNQDAPDGGDSGGGGCAVCHFIAGLDAPPPVTLGVAPLGFLRSLPPERSPAAPARHAALPFHGLDPPLA